jgi:signal transduction histidine kinase
MNKDKGTLEQDALRRRAEEALRDAPPAFPPSTDGEMRKLLHELQVHQIELEMQNEELRQARTEMEAALEKYTDLYDFAPVGYMTLDGAGVIGSINLTAAGLLGRPRSQLTGRPFGFLVAVGSHDAFQDFLGRALTSQSRETCEVELLGNDRESLALRLEGVACSAKECRMALIDITENRKIDAELKRLHINLERHAFELQVVNDELEAFTHTVSHDLRSPLTVIDGYCQMLAEVYGERLDDEGRRYLQEIQQGVQGMTELIDTLLNFACLSRSELHKEPVNLSAIAKAVALELGKEQPGRRVTFSIAPGVSAHGDARLLRVGLQNLLGNAWKFTGQKEDVVIEFGVTAKAGESAFFVRDNGPGFDSAHADHLFRAFQRLPGGEQFKGFGIGLATVQRIIQLHGGQIWAEGELGMGATFYFTLG